MEKLAAVLLACALGAPAADPGLVKLAMPDARVVAGVNASKIRASAFGQFLLAQVAAQRTDFQNFITATGFDPRYNLDEILFASPGGAGESRKLVAARGTFDPSKIIELARSAGAEITTYQGVDVISGLTTHGPHATPGSLAFLDSTLAVAGDDQSVRDAIDRRQATASALSTGLNTKVANLSAAQDAWFVSLVPISELATRVPNTKAAGPLNSNALQAIQQASGGVNFSAEPVKLSAEVLTSTAQDATSLADVVRFLAGLVRMQPPKSGHPQPLLPLLNTLDVKPVGASVQLALSIPEQQLESIVRAGHP